MKNNENWSAWCYSGAMQIQYKQGSILDAPEKYIIHGCNAQGAMGSGVAKVLYERYPEVRRCYMHTHMNKTAANEPFLGTLHYVWGKPHTVINGITQEFYGKDGKLYASYEAIEQVFTQLNADAGVRNADDGGEYSNMTAVAMPLIGAGLAGGSWKIISEIIERTATNYQPVVYLVDGVIPTS